MITVGTMTVAGTVTSAAEEEAKKEKPKCNCGSHVLHYGKLDMINGRIHSVLGCEIVGVLDIGPMALAVESARQILLRMVPTDASVDAIEHLDAALAILNRPKGDRK